MGILRLLIIKIRERMWQKELRRRNHNIDVSIICNNCIGGVIYKNLGLQFLTPTINLFLTADDYLLFAQNLEYYLGCSMEEIENGAEYPVGKLVAKDKMHTSIYVYFRHYKNYEEAKKKWYERAKRVNLNNVVFMFEFFDEKYNLETLYKFDRMPGKKIALLHKEIENVENGFVFRCHDHQDGDGKLFQYNGLSGKRFLDEFDYTGFLNCMT